jgi:hypothetical protein
VTGQGDRAEAHATRIAAKRLRYLLEGVADAAHAAKALIEELKALQDTLGELHDAQLFGGELATMISELLAENGTSADGSGRTKHPAGPRTRSGPVPGLRVLSRRMRRAEETAFKRYTRAWSPPATDAFAGRIIALTTDLRGVGAVTVSRRRSARARGAP